MSGFKVLLAEPWWAGSHRAWAEGYQHHSRHDVAIVSLSASGWRWRHRAGAVPLADQIIDWAGRHGSPDALLISGLVDVAQLVGLIRRTLDPSTPVAIYQHESQLVYRSDRPDAEGSLRDWVSWCAADAVVFNSSYHRSAVETALGPFLASSPEPAGPTIINAVQAKFEMVAPGFDPVGVDPAAASPGAPVIIWPHRWDSDKDPDAFLAALRRLRSRGKACRLVLAGDDPMPEAVSPIRTAIEDEFASWVLASGPFTREEYRRWLQAGDIVVSCARHELFGLGVVEAISAGCLPVLPDALSYPEILGSADDVMLYPPGSFGSAMEDAVDRFARDPAPSFADRQTLATAMDRWSWPNVAPVLDQLLCSIDVWAENRLLGDD